MAAAAACRRVGGYQFGGNSGGIGFGRGGSGAVSLSTLGLISQNRKISQLVNSNGRRLFLVDTLALNALIQETSLSKFKSEVQNSQDNPSLCIQSIVHEVDKLTAGQRLDLNLERGRIREELANQNAETTNLTNKLDGEIHGLRAQLEAGKYEVIKYCLGTLVSISAVGLAAVRILM
ncbi:hypothetical protein OIU74_004702 [Salix koriyanagi]|uniref:Uncharacterized protein n=1 Tax=Salix koriyanagi TaxID=2511006 RepID=A0A9Q0UMC0_9ROSI|nr:hypothetical protein OIU74_004702 [Salix koriyanagi]